MQKNLCLIIFLLFSLTSFAQSYLKKENNVWIATSDELPPGSGSVFPAVGLDFNTTPVSSLDAAAPIGQHVLGHSTGMASVCDKNGNLLFYTDGNIVWDRNNNVMVNGWGINDGNSPPYHLAQSYFGGIASSFNRDGVVIVPVPGSSHKYYIFSIVFVLLPEPDGSYINDYGVWEGKLRYSVVDMEKNNGAGEVEMDRRGIVMADSMSGNLQVVTGEDCNYWLVGNFVSGGFRSFNITAAGVDTNAVVSTVTLPLSSTIWELNISPDRSQLAEAFSEEVQLCRFDAATGIVSDYSPAPVLLGTQYTYSIAFSPNSSKLYLGGIIGIRQYDISGPMPVFNYPPLWQDTTAYEFYGPLRLGPDNKIYFNYYAYSAANTYSGWAIHDPDQTGAACDIDSIPDAPLLLKRYGGGSQFPNEVAVIVYDTTTRIIKAPICFNDSSVLLQPVSAPDTGTDYHWKFKNGVNYVAIGTDTAALKVTLPGIYTVRYFTAAPCTFHQDTFLVDHVNFSLSLLRNDPQLASCDGQPITLDPYTDAKNPVYLWQDSSTAATLAANASGQYKVSISSQGCTATDSIHVFITDVRQSLRDDTVLCAEKPEQSVLLQASVPQGAAVLWSTGSTDAAIYVADSGWYSVTVTDSGCVGTDSFHLDREFCECPVLFPTAFSPNSDGRNDHYSPAVPGNCSITAYKMEIYNRWGQRVYVGYDGDKGWDGTFNGKPADVGTYMYRLQMTVGLEKETIIKNGDFVLLR